MNARESVGIELDDDGTAITDILERAEMLFRSRQSDDKYYVTLGELFLLASQPDLDRETRIEQDVSGNWVIQVYYSRMIFIHVTPMHDFSGERIN